MICCNCILCLFKQSTCYLLDTRLLLGLLLHLEEDFLRDSESIEKDDDLSVEVALTKGGTSDHVEPPVS